MNHSSFFRRLLCLVSVLCLLTGTGFAKTKATPTPAPRETTTTVAQEVPETIQKLLDLAYSEWSELNGQKLKKSNKYTKWRNNYEWGWCAGFVTWLMLQLDVPMERMADMKEEPLEGVIHVKEASVAKVMRGYMKAGRSTDVPQKGFLIVYGSTKDPVSKTVHIGLVYDVQELGDGKYRITTIEGNMSNTVRMYVHDYDRNADKTKNLSAIPEEERTEPETTAFTYKMPSKNWYANVFLMPWIPEDYAPEATATPAPTRNMLTPITPAP